MDDEITYCNVDTSPFEFVRNHEVIDLDKMEIINDVIEVNTKEGWLIRDIRTHPSVVRKKNFKSVGFRKERLEGNFKIVRCLPAYQV